MRHEGQGRDGHHRLKRHSAESPDPEKERRVGNRIVQRSREFGAALDCNDLSARNRCEEAPDHRGLDEAPDEKEEDLVQHRDRDEKRHICALGRFWNGLPVDGKAEDVHQRSTRDGEGEYMPSEYVL